MWLANLEPVTSAPGSYHVHQLQVLPVFVQLCFLRCHSTDFFHMCDTLGGSDDRKSIYRGCERLVIFLGCPALFPTVLGLGR